MKPNFLAAVLTSDHPLFTRTIADFEKASGNSGVDTRLIANMRETAHSVMRSLGLAPSDTSAEELYHALNSVIQSGNLALLANTQYTLLPFDNGPVSFNLLDVMDNARNKLSFAERKIDRAQRHLRLEIVRRYAEHDRTSDELVYNLAAQAGLRIDDDEAHGVDDERQMQELKDEPARPRILTIGDIFTDAFIKLNESSAKVIKEADGKEWLALPFGQKPPYDTVDIVRSVGPSPNAAVSAARLGLDAHLMAWVGGDEVGVEALDYLKQERVGVDSMIVEKDKLTSYWYVLRYGADRTMLVKSEKYRYEWVAPDKKPDWIYLSYIGADSWPLHEALLTYLDENQDVKLAFQPGTFHFTWGSEKLKDVYGRSHIVVMNREEAVEVTGRGYDDLKSLSDGLHELGPKIVVITDGPNGSYASFDNKLVTIPNYPDPAKPLDRTGAGDAFASTIVSALALGETMETALTWAPINSMNVVQKLGAQAGLLSRDKLLKFLEDAPSDYFVKPL